MQGIVQGNVISRNGEQSKASLMWKLRNALRWGFLKGLIGFYFFKPLANRFGVTTLMGTLTAMQRVWLDDVDRERFLGFRRQDTARFNARLAELEAALGRAASHDEYWALHHECYTTSEAFAEGRTKWIDYGLLTHLVITDAGVTYMRDDFNNNAQDVTLFNFHGCGTGNTAEAAGDTALVTESASALNPDNTRATGTRSTPASNQFRSVGTLTFDASAAVVEHGFFSQAATGGGTLWDRSVFSAINAASGDSIQFTYTLTLTSGG
jgi:hypothetical protein